MTFAPQNDINGVSNVWRRACVACARAKRRCSKQTPACRRCHVRGISCVYLPARPETRLLHDTETRSTASPNEAEDASAFVSRHFAVPPLPVVPEQTEVAFLRASQRMHYVAIHVPTDAWFLASESFIADHSITPGNPGPIADSHLKYFIGCVQKWQRDWVTEGRSPLHHHRLYRPSMPRHVQDAYTAVTMYMARNPQNEDTSFQIISDRATQLIDDQTLEDAICDSRDMFGHLSRVQSLLTYQVIRLFDGNIRMRAQADAQLHTLFKWNRDMMEATKQCLSEPRFPIFHNLNSDAATAIWDSWILVESIRRTWLIANYVQQIYLYFKLGWSECPGRVLFTMRSGLWDAPSELAWEKTSRELGPLFVSIVNNEMLFAETRSDEVDAFGHAILTIELGLEKMERWLE
ncbi:hypothetical protein B0T10DRAFT_515829 [Thelonectria olida]|uniref:Zn(2)-C6 fungal-type domain-containing protein n=1 Tax=Thelonectria olida TaxID=1576542 RepID=A0A9P8W1J3_9HYPO|nr:hypothetical protein B0T10DRAFT_515829 [Thelonectria olida]